MCDVGSGVIVPERYFLRSEKASIDRFFQVLQLSSVEIGGEIFPVRLELLVGWAGELSQNTQNDIF